MDIWSLPLDRALNTLYALLVENRDEQARFRLDADLDMPTPAQMERARDDLWWNHEADAAAFEVAEKQFGGMFG